MDKYTAEFLNDVIDSISNDEYTASYYQFYMDNRSEAGYSRLEFKEFVLMSLEKHFESRLRGPHLREAIRKLKAAKKSRFVYLYKQAASSIYLDFDDKKNPLYFIKDLSPERKRSNFGSISDEGIREASLQKLDKWKDEVLSITEFPFPEMSGYKKKKITDLSIDVALAAWKYVESELDGDITRYNNFYLTEFVGMPILPATMFTNNLTKKSEGLYEAIIEDDSGQLLLRLYSDEDTPSVMVNDIRIIMDYIIRVVQDSISEIVSNGRILELPLIESANLLVDYHINSQILERTRRVWRYVRNIQMEYKNDMMAERHFSILNDLQFLIINDEERVRMEVSAAYVEQIVADRIIKVKSSDYNSLENNIAKMLFHALKVKSVLSPIQKNGYAFLDYYFFLSNIQFTGRWVEDSPTIEEALKDYVDKKILISDYYMDNKGFHVKYLKEDEDDKVI